MAGPKTAVVLAGGGTKGAFEAGAVRYLVEEEQLLPQILTAASAGAVAAAVLAQARTPKEFAQRSAEGQRRDHDPDPPNQHVDCADDVVEGGVPG